MSEGAKRGSLTAKLGSIVLGLEALIVFLAGLTIYGLDATPGNLPAWWGVVWGIVMMLLMIFTAGLFHRNEKAAIWLGSILQGVVALAGFLVPAIFLVTLILGGMWWYCMATGQRLDRADESRATN